MHYTNNSASFSSAECLDGVSVPRETDSFQKWRESHAPTKNKKYTIIFKSILDGSNRSFSVRANSVVEAVRACREAHPNADIVEVY